MELLGLLALVLLQALHVYQDRLRFQSHKQDIELLKMRLQDREKE
jgi:hypothetical protein